MQTTTRGPAAEQNSATAFNSVVIETVAAGMSADTSAIGRTSLPTRSIGTRSPYAYSFWAVCRSSVRPGTY